MLSSAIDLQPLQVRFSGTYHLCLARMHLTIRLFISCESKLICLLFSGILQCQYAFVFCLVNGSVAGSVRITILREKARHGRGLGRYRGESTSAMSSSRNET